MTGKRKSSTELIEGGNEDGRQKTTGKKQNISAVLIIPKKTARTKPLENLSPEPASCDLRGREDDPAYLDRLYELFKQRAALEEKSAIQKSQDEKKQMEIEIAMAIQKKVEANIPLIVTHVFDTQFKTFMSNKKDIKNIITNSSRDLSSSIDFLNTLTEIVPVSLNKLKIEFPSLSYAW